MFLSAKEKEFILEEWAKNANYDYVIEQYQQNRRKNPERFHLVTKETIDQLVAAKGTTTVTSSSPAPVVTTAVEVPAEATVDPASAAKATTTKPSTASSSPRPATSQATQSKKQLQTWASEYDRCEKAIAKLREETNDILQMPIHYSVHDKCFEDCNRIATEMASVASPSTEVQELLAKAQNLQEVLVTLRPESAMSITLMRKKLLDSFKVGFGVASGVSNTSSSAVAASDSAAAETAETPVAARTPTAARKKPAKATKAETTTGAVETSSAVVPATAVPAASTTAPAAYRPLDEETFLNDDNEMEISYVAEPTVAVATPATATKKTPAKRKRLSTSSMGLDHPVAAQNGDGGSTEEDEKLYLDRAMEAARGFFTDMNDEEKASYASDSKRKRMRGLVSALEYLVLIQNIYDEAKEQIVLFKGETTSSSLRFYDPCQEKVPSKPYIADATTATTDDKSVCSVSSDESSIELDTDSKINSLDNRIKELHSELMECLRERSVLKPYSLNKDASSGLALVSSDISKQSMNIRVNITEDYATMMHELFNAGLPRKSYYNAKLKGAAESARLIVNHTKTTFLQPGRKLYVKKPSTGTTAAPTPKKVKKSVTDEEGGSSGVAAVVAAAAAVENLDPDSEGDSEDEV